MRTLLLAAIALACPQMAAAQDAPAKVLAPSSGWLLDYADDRCRIIRTFGEGEDKMLVFFDQVEPKGRVDWLVSGPALSDVKSKDEVRVQFGPGNEPFEVAQQGISFPEYGAALTSTGYSKLTVVASGTDPDALPLEEIWKEVRTLDPEQGAGVEWLDLRSERGGAVRMELGDLKPVHVAMNACMADLLTSWGLDAKRELARSTGPEPENLLSVAQKIQQRYPFRALRSGESGLIAARVLVDADGQPGECTITQLSDAEKFGAGVCRDIVTTARFSPAKDANGVPMPSYYLTRIRYVAPSSF